MILDAGELIHLAVLVFYQKYIFTKNYHHQIATLLDDLWHITTMIEASARENSVTDMHATYEF